MTANAAADPAMQLETTAKLESDLTAFMPAVELGHGRPSVARAPMSRGERLVAGLAAAVVLAGLATGAPISASLPTASPAAAATSAAHPNSGARPTPRY